MLAQVRAMRTEADHPVAGVLFLGMGEPLLNYDNVIRGRRSCRTLPAGIAGESISIQLWAWPGHPALRSRGTSLPLDHSLAAATGEARLPLMPAENAGR